MPSHTTNPSSPGNTTTTKYLGKNTAEVQLTFINEFGPISLIICYSEEHAASEKCASPKKVFTSSERTEVHLIKNAYQGIKTEYKGKQTAARADLFAINVEAITTQCNTGVTHRSAGKHLSFSS